MSHHQVAVFSRLPPWARELRKQARRSLFVIVYVAYVDQRMGSGSRVGYICARPAVDAIARQFWWYRPGPGKTMAFVPTSSLCVRRSGHQGHDAKKRGALPA